MTDTCIVCLGDLRVAPEGPNNKHIKQEGDNDEAEPAGDLAVQAAAHAHAPLQNGAKSTISANERYPRSNPPLPRP